MASPATNLLKSGGRQASDTLSAAIDAADLALPLNSADEFDNNTMVVIVDEGTASEEEMEVSGKTGSSLTVVTRGVNGTSATGHDSGATVSAILSDWQWDQVIDAITEEHDDDGVHDSDKVATLSSGAMTSAWNGWQSVSDTWAFASATTITVPSGAASEYQKGDKFKLTANSVVLQGSIVTVADTLLTVVGDTLTDHTFTLNYYSKAENPQDFPHWFDYTCTWDALTASPTVGDASIDGRFRIVGNDCHVRLTFIFGGTSSGGTGDWTFSIPLTAADESANCQYIGIAKARDVGASNFIGISVINNNSSVISIIDSSNNSWDVNNPMTWVHGDYFNIDIMFKY